MAKPKRQPQAQRQPDLSIVPDRPCFIQPTTLRPQTEAQRLLMSSLRANTLTLVSGPAGTGKTYVSLAIAAQMLQENQIERIIITRPMVGVDEQDLGALPGNVDEKLAPWMLPSLDVLVERLGKSFVDYLMKVDRIRVSPLALMRGSSFKDSFLFITETQNATVKQIKMLLTRVGDNTRVCVEGDPNQSDLRGPNGLQDAITRLNDLPHVGIVEFDRNDVVRSAFCKAVLERYET